jgi:hypothetical protein
VGEGKLKVESKSGRESAAEPVKPLGREGCVGRRIPQGPKPNSLLVIMSELKLRPPKEKSRSLASLGVTMKCGGGNICEPKMAAGAAGNRRWRRKRWRRKAAATDMTTETAPV